MNQETGYFNYNWWYMYKWTSLRSVYVGNISKAEVYMQEVYHGEL